MSSCSSSSVTSAIEHYKRKLEKYASSSDPATVLHCLNKLDRLSSQLSINVLQETGIGRYGER